MGFPLGARNYAAHRRAIHPVDVIEQLADGHGWLFERGGRDEITASITGSAVEYQLAFSWLEEHETLHLSCAFQVHIAPQRAAELTRLLALVNEKLLFGHFDCWQQTGQIIYRQTLLLSGGLHPTEAQIKTLLMTALDACEAYCGACRNVVLGQISADDALRHSLFETLGNA